MRPAHDGLGANCIECNYQEAASLHLWKPRGLLLYISATRAMAPFHSTMLLLSSKSFRGHLRMPSSHSQEQELTSLEDPSKIGLSLKGQRPVPGMPQDFTQSSIKKTGAPCKFWAGPGMCLESYRAALELPRVPVNCWSGGLERGML